MRVSHVIYAKEELQSIRGVNRGAISDQKRAKEYIISTKIKKWVKVKVRIWMKSECTWLYSKR